MARREAINTELATAPGPIPDLDQAQQVLEDFSIFWQNETDPAAKRQLLTLIFERIWREGQHVAAVQPKPSFAPFFENQPPETAGKGMCKERERRGSVPDFAPRVRSLARATVGEPGLTTVWSLHMLWATA